MADLMMHNISGKLNTLSFGLLDSSTIQYWQILLSEIIQEMVWNDGYPFC